MSNVSMTSDKSQDRVVYESVVQQYSVADSTTPTIEIKNPIGEACFTTLSWSVDNISFYPAQAVVAPTNPYTANIWCGDEYVYIYFENFSGSTKTFYFKYALDLAD